MHSAGNQQSLLSMVLLLGSEPSSKPTDATLETVSAALDFLSLDADDSQQQPVEKQEEPTPRVPHPPTPQENILDEFGIYPPLAEVVDELVHEEEEADDDDDADSATEMATATGTTTNLPASAPTAGTSTTFLPDDARYDAPDYLPENHLPVDQAHFHLNCEYPPANCADDSKFDRVWYYSQRHPEEGSRYN